jgi:hypothetical protein|tara:strand:- start:1884 stop:2147 length:264 start_codon:yes stop_codon:yes gene_type:complete
MKKDNIIRLVSSDKRVDTSFKRLMELVTKDIEEIPPKSVLVIIDRGDSVALCTSAIDMDTTLALIQKTQFQIMCDLFNGVSEDDTVS